MSRKNRGRGSGIRGRGLSLTEGTVIDPEAQTRREAQSFLTDPLRMFLSPDFSPSKNQANMDCISLCGPESSVRGVFQAAPISVSRIALCMCILFSDWSQTTDDGPSRTELLISSPRCAGRQCMTMASLGAFFIRVLLT